MDEDFLPERAQRLWDIGFPPSAVDRYMEWPSGRCRALLVVHFARVEVPPYGDADPDVLECYGYDES